MVFLHTTMSETEIGWQNEYTLCCFHLQNCGLMISKQVLLFLFRKIHVGQMFGKRLQT